jgi:hypothetical protein
MSDDRTEAEAATVAERSQGIDEPAAVPRVVDPGRRSDPARVGDYRELLRSRRWDAAPLRNPEVERTDPRIAVAFVVILCVLTLIIIVAGYGSGFWSLPTQ